MPSSQLVRGVLEALGDDDAGDGAVDADDGVGVEPRRLDEAAVLSRLKQEGAGVHVAGLDGGSFARLGVLRAGENARQRE